MGHAERCIGSYDKMAELFRTGKATFGSRCCAAMLKRYSSVCQAEHKTAVARGWLSWGRVSRGVQHPQQRTSALGLVMAFRFCSPNYSTISHGLEELTGQAHGYGPLPRSFKWREHLGICNAGLSGKEPGSRPLEAQRLLTTPFHSAVDYLVKSSTET